MPSLCVHTVSVAVLSLITFLSLFLFCMQLHELHPSHLLPVTMFFSLLPLPHLAPGQSALF